MLLANETVAQHLVRSRHADAVPHPRGARRGEGRGVRGVHLLARLHAGGAGAQLQPKHFQKLVKAIEGTPEERAIAMLMLRTMQQARYDAVEPRPLRPRREELLPLHVAHPPLSGPGRAPLAARAAAGAAHRGARAGAGRRSCRRRRATRPTASAGPTRPSARSSSGRRSASWPTRSARSSRAT